jgi:hypothetical protein
VAQRSTNAEPVERRDRGSAMVIVFSIAVFLSMAMLVVMGVRRVEPPTFSPTPLEPVPAESHPPGPRLFTIDATAPDEWRFFSFERGTVVERPGPRDWDLAFRRFQVIVNGGPGFAGAGGVLDLGEATLDEPRHLPRTGDYVVNTVRSDTVNAALRRWYRYSYLSHLLSPRPNVWSVRTAAGSYAALQFVGYYCPGAMPGCVTFRYLYPGDADADGDGAVE